MAVLIAEIVLSLLAVFGLYAAVLLFALRPARGDFAVAVKLSAPMPLAEAKRLLTVARRQYLLEGYPVVVLVDAALLADEGFVALLDEVADICYVVEEEKR